MENSSIAEFKRMCIYIVENNFLPEADIRKRSGIDEQTLKMLMLDKKQRRDKLVVKTSDIVKMQAFMRDHSYYYSLDKEEYFKKIPKPRKPRKPILKPELTVKAKPELPPMDPDSLLTDIMLKLTKTLSYCVSAQNYVDVPTHHWSSYK